MNEHARQEDNEAGEFQAAASGQRTGLVREFWDFLRHNKKWWLAPILLIMLLVGLAVVLSSTGAGPFIYALF